MYLFWVVANSNLGPREQRKFAAFYHHFKDCDCDL